MPADTRPPGRVLFVTHNVPRFAGDAAGSFVLRLAVALQDAGVQVDILAPASTERTGVEVIEGVRIERVRYASPSRMTLAYRGRMAEDVRAGWGARLALLGLLYHMRRAIRRRIADARREGKPFDVVHAHWWFPGGLMAWSAGIGASIAVPLVVTMHGSDVRLAQGVGASHAVMRRVLQRARAVTAVSHWLADTAMRIVPSVHVDVGPMPVDTTVFIPPMYRAQSKQAPIERQTDSDADETNLRSGILFVGRLNSQKGVADLLDAFARIPDSDIILRIVGDGPDERALKARADTLQLTHRVQWLGALAQPQLVPLYQQAAVVAMPSREEGLGLVAVEAQLCETPVVAYDSGGLPDVVDPERGGTLVTPGDIAALAQQLHRFAANTDEAAARVNAAGIAARNAMLDTFSPPAVARRYIGWYGRSDG